MQTRLYFALVAGLASTPTWAQDAEKTRAVTSSGPDQVELTVYRAQNGDSPINRANPNGFAMVTETRKVRLPRGRSELRFEGVAEGIIPVSAVIEGLPGGTIEKNRNAQLLSPASLVDGTLGRHVTITRTNKDTGAMVSEQATIIAGPQSGVILQTATGIESLRCSGLPEKLAFGSVPGGLSSKPILNVITENPSARTVTVRLSYLASGFDWRASYVVTQAMNEQDLEVFAWLTLANGNGQSYSNAQVNAVAGRLNRVHTNEIRAAAAKLSLTCYPLGTTTSDLPVLHNSSDEITVTARRWTEDEMDRMPMPMLASPAAPPPPPPPPPENLGDLKLYRVPSTVTVAAHSQKQVALLNRGKVPFKRRYRLEVWPHQKLVHASTSIVLQMENTPEAGLGIALPQGTTALYLDASGNKQLLGLGTLSDRAEGEKFRLSAGTSTQVTVSQIPMADNKTSLTAHNANPFPVQIDIPIGSAGQEIRSDNATLTQVEGVMTWSPTLGPGETADIQYTVIR